MDGATFITRVVLENYKSIAHCDVRLGPLTYLVGANGAGKSNFLDALRFIADSLNSSLDVAIRERGGLPGIIRRVEPKPYHFRIRLELNLPDQQSGLYEVTVGFREGRTEVLEEYCQVKPPGAGQEAKFYRLTPDNFESNFSWSPRVRRDRLCLVNAAGTSEMRSVFDRLTTMRFYNISPIALKRWVVVSAETFLEPDGGNITYVLTRLGTGKESVKTRIEEYLRIILPTLDFIQVEDVGPGLMLQFWQKLASYHHPQPFWPAQMSDGTLRALGILTALLQGNVETGPRPSLVAIEEPEAQVNPAILAVLRDAMLEASYCTQVLVTTHSSDLLDSKEVSGESLLAVAAEEGVTHIGPIVEEGKDMIRQRLYTPGELLRIGQLFPEGGQNGSNRAAGRPEPVGGAS